MKILLPHRRSRGSDVRSLRIAALPVPDSGPSPSRQSRVRQVRRRRIRKDLRASVADSASFSVMVGIGETYLPGFVLAMGMGEIAAGLISSIPLLVGAVLQLVSPMAVARLGSHRRWVVLCAALQAASFLPLVAGALWGSLPIVVMFLVASVYWGSGLAAGPAWNTWIETVVPSQVRAPFFAWRSRLGQAGVLAGFLAGGAALHFGHDAGRRFQAFAAIFVIAAACRFLSARFLWTQSETTGTQASQRLVPIGELLGRMRAGGSERMLLYFLSVQVAVQISGPYFTPYMLGQLKISYLDFVSLLAASLVARIVALPALGRFAYRFGAQRLLWLGGVGIVPTAGLWLYANSFMDLVLIQFLAGVAWAAYELAMFLLFFETVDRNERTSILTTFNLGNCLALVIGASIGGVVLKFLGECPEAYLTLFALSSSARALALICLLVVTSAAVVAPPLKRQRGFGSWTLLLPEPATVNAPPE